MEMIDEVLSDEARSVENCSKHTASSADLSELLKYQGNLSVSYRSSTSRNTTSHSRRSCFTPINSQEEDLLDEFFNTVQDYICQQQEQVGSRKVTSRMATSPQSMVSFGGAKYERDIIDFVFENVENVTCNRPSDTTTIPLPDALEKLQTLGKTIHIELYRKDPEAVRKRVDEWMAGTFRGQTYSLLPEGHKKKDEIEVEREKSSDFMDLFFSRMEQVLCVKVSLDKHAGGKNKIDDKDVQGLIFENVDSAASEIDDVSSTYPLLRSERSHRTNTSVSNQSRSPSALLLSPASAASTSFGGTPRSLGGESVDYRSLASESDFSYSSYTVASSMGTYSRSEYSSRFNRSVLSPKSERSERTEESGSCLSPKSETSYTEHTKRTISRSGHTSKTAERDNRALLTASYSQEDEDRQDDESTAFDVANRPLFVIKEEVSATESMLSDRRQKEQQLLQEQKYCDKVSSTAQPISLYSSFNRKGNKKYSFRYSSAYYKFGSQRCSPDGAAHAARDWLGRFKHAIEFAVHRLTAAFNSMDTDEFCHSSKKQSEEENDRVVVTDSVKDIFHQPLQLKKWSSALNQVKDKVATENMTMMCNGQNIVDERDDAETIDTDFDSVSQYSSTIGVAHRSQFDTANPMTSLGDDAVGNSNSPSFQSFTTRYKSHYESIADISRRQREPPEQRRSSTEKPLFVPRSKRRGRDPEPSIQWKLDRDSIVGGFQNYTSCGPKEIKSLSQTEIPSPRSSDTEKTAELTAVTTSDPMPEDCYDVNNNSAIYKPVSEMTVHLTDSKIKYVDSNRDISPQKELEPRTRESSSHSSKTKEMSFHTANIFSIFDDDERTIYSHDNESTCYSYPPEMDIQQTCTDIVLYEEKPDFIQLWFGKDSKYPVSPWQLVVYVAWLSVSFLVRVNGEMNSHLADRKRALQAILEDEERSYCVPNRGYSRDSLDIVPSIECQLSLG